MKNFTLLICFFTLMLNAQVIDKGNPVSWTKSANTSEKIILEETDMNRVMFEDEESKDKIGVPYRIGIQKNINLSLQSNGQWTTLENGDRLWKLNIKSPNALHLSVNFSEFNLPEGATLHLYNNSKTDLIGAYTNLNNNETNQLGTWLIKGDDIWLEYFEPANVMGLGKLQLSSVIHVYRLQNKHQNDTDNQRINESASCNQDVDCPVGADFDTMKDELKHTAAFLNLGNGYVCSGNLVNNTSEDKTPYFLTANHCFTNPQGVDSNPAQYSMRFNWISPNPSCATNTGSTNSATNYVMNGSQLRAKNAGSDFMLVELNNNIPQNWDIRYAGWDKSDTDPTFEVGIHHPSGDIMKVSRDNSGATKTNAGGTAVWLIGGTSFGAGSGWELGVTEGGSSGSSLFDQNGRVIGQLYAGLAACAGLNDNNDYDIYGRFAASWTGSNTNSTRLSNWLDPVNSGQSTIDLLDNASTASVDSDELNSFIAIYPNPSTGNLTIDLNGLEGNFKYEVINLLGQIVKSDLLSSSKTTMDISNLENNIYLLKITNTTTEQSKVQKFVLNK